MGANRYGYGICMCMCVYDLCMACEGYAYDGCMYVYDMDMMWISCICLICYICCCFCSRHDRLRHVGSGLDEAMVACSRHLHHPPSSLRLCLQLLLLAGKSCFS